MNSIKNILSIAALIVCICACSSPKNVQKERNELYYISSEIDYDFNKVYKDYMKANFSGVATELSIDQGLFFLLQTAIKEQKSYAFPATKLFYRYLQYTLEEDKASKTLDYVLQATEAIMDKDELKAWESAESPKEKYQYLIQFWNNADPDPSTLANEALLVFGQRLAGAINIFQPLGFKSTIDDRAKVYIKYGEPTERREHTFALTSLKLWLDRAYDPLNFDYGDGSSLTQRRIITDQAVKAMVMQTERIFVNPKMELWVYEGLSTSENQTLFMFGENESNKFVKIDTPEEIIPRELKRNGRPVAGMVPRSNPVAGILAAMYEEMPQIHYKIVERKVEMLSRLGSKTFQGPFKSINVTNLDRSEMTGYFKQEHGKLDEMHFTNNKESYIPISNKVYRFMEDDGSLSYLLYMYSNPAKTITSTLGKSIEDIQEDVKLSHSLQIIDDNRNIKSSLTDSPSITLIPNPRADGFYPVQSVFALKADSLFNDSFRLKATLRQINSPRGVEIDKLTGLVGYGKIDGKLPEKISIESDKPFLSDIILGYKVQDNLSQINVDRYNIPFWVPDIAEIPLGLDLSLYFEVYNLQGEKPSFDLNYELEKAGFLGILFDMKSRSEVRTVFNSVGKSHKVDLSLQLADLKEGRYNLKLEIIDKFSGKKIKENIEFSVLDVEKRLEEQSKKINKRLGIDGK